MVLMDKKIFFPLRLIEKMKFLNFCGAFQHVHQYRELAIYPSVNYDCHFYIYYTMLIPTIQQIYL